MLTEKEKEIVEQEKPVPDWWNIAMPWEFKTLLEDVAARYAYARLSDAARATMRVGSRLALENSEEYLRLLNGNG